MRKVSIEIRRENISDFEQVYSLIKEAFKDDEHSDHLEQELVNRLRESKSFIPEFSLVAELDSRIVGYILLTKIKINNVNSSFDSLALAPVAVLPKFQNHGIGSILINEAHKVAVSLGYKSIVVLGHKDYYPRFGYKPCSNFNIKLPFDVPAEYCMALELVADGLLGVSGTVEYDAEFLK